MGMIPIVVLCITGDSGVDSLLSQPIIILHMVKMIGGPVLPKELFLYPTYLEVRQIGVA